MPWLLSTSWFSRTRLLGAGRLRLVAPFFGPLPALNFAFAETLLLLAARFLPLFLFFFFIFALRNRAAQFERIKIPLNRHASLHSTPFFQINKLQAPRPRSQIQPRHRNRQMESPRPRAARIYIHHSIPLAAPRFVRMPAHHNLKSRRPRIQVQRVRIM